jgi:hypothetical protein
VVGALPDSAITFSGMAWASFSTTRG